MIYPTPPSLTLDNLSFRIRYRTARLDKEVRSIRAYAIPDSAVLYLIPRLHDQASIEPARRASLIVYTGCKSRSNRIR